MAAGDHAPPGGAAHPGPTAGREHTARPEGALGAGAGTLAVFDPFSGISGDMILGCWVDLGRDAGLDREWLLSVAEGLRLPVEDVRVERVRRAGLSAWKVMVVPEGGDVEVPPDMEPGRPASGGGHGEAHGHAHPGRTYAEIRELLETGDLDERARGLALGAFERLARAEGRVHGVASEEVHFHEVGAVDAVLDVAAAADGWVRLGIAEGRTTPVAIGSGSVDIGHGRYPVPAPATAYLLEGTALRPTGYPYELVTPTGAALLAQFCGGRAPTGDLTVRRVGYGAGSRDPEDHPNCLRVWLSAARDATDTVLVLQADVDDMAPEYVPDLLRACLDAGALDAVVIGTQMKKGRAGWRLEVQVESGMRDAVEEAVLRHSTTLGLRSWPVSRRVLARALEERKWRGHTIRVKRRASAGPGDAPRAKAEHDDVAAAAAAEGLPAQEVLRRLRQEWPDLQ